MVCADYHMKNLAIASATPASRVYLPKREDSILRARCPIGDNIQAESGDWGQPLV